MYPLECRPLISTNTLSIILVDIVLQVTSSKKYLRIFSLKRYLSYDGIKVKVFYATFSYIVAEVFRDNVVANKTTLSFEIAIGARTKDGVLRLVVIGR